MSIWGTMAGWVTGGGGGLSGAAEKVSGIFRPNAEKGAQRDHSANMATLDQFSSEFRQLKKRTWWDSFIDGLNRLPRPLITLGVLGMFVLAPVDPELFISVAEAYSLMPAGFWGLLSIIIAFYFGGRMQAKAGAFSVSNEQVQAAKEMSAMRRQRLEPEEDLVLDEPEPLVSSSASKNRVVQYWLETNRS